MRLESKLRRYDEKASEIISNYLDEKFYNEYCTDVKRINTRQEQVKGIDIRFKLNGREYVCDEKAAIRYINKHLGTFSMELSFIDRGNMVHDGWLIDEEKVNDSFLFCWIDTANLDANGEINSSNDVKEMEIALVQRSKILDYLESKGWTVEKLDIKGERLRDNEDEPQGSIKENGLKFVVSRQLVEKPVNVLIPRDILLKISDFNLKIS